jgi:acyl-CoA reductase-like NAD-dependent aldehyde dehydrogenase
VLSHWNFPLLMAAWKLGPALTTGNEMGHEALQACTEVKAVTTQL